MSKVYIPQMPTRFDRATNLWIPTINITPAKRFGDLVTMLPSAATRNSIETCTQVLNDCMEDYGPEDVIVALGDPSVYAIAACIAVKKTNGLLRMLKWDRQLGDYLLVEVQV